MLHGTLQRLPLNEEQRPHLPVDRFPAALTGAADGSIRAASRAAAAPST
jgi:hypothetical protein